MVAYVEMFTQYDIAVVSCIFFCFCNKFLEWNVIPIPEKYQNGKQWVWREALVSVLHAAISGTMAAIR